MQGANRMFHGRLGTRHRRPRGLQRLVPGFGSGASPIRALACGSDDRLALGFELLEEGVERRLELLDAFGQQRMHHGIEIDADVN